MNITIQDKEYPLQWGMGAIEIYCDLTGYESIASLDRIFGVDEAGNIISDIEQQKAFRTFVFAAIKNGCEVYKKVCDVNYYQVSAAIDEMEQETANLIVESFRASKLNGRTVGEILETAANAVADSGQKKSEALA
jgi:hypothetical protein